MHVAALLLELDPRTGVVMAVDAGSPRLVLLRGGEVAHRPLDPQFPLGMFETSDYVPQRIELQPADRLFVVSDGVVEAANASSRYGEAAVHRFIRRTRALAPLQAVRSLLGDLRSFLGDDDLDDDAVAVCLDWNGPTA
jgi:serine phosphatase RsbU (regulator of sigma subunit)